MSRDYFGDDCFEDNMDDVCYECGGYGDDYSVDENGELVCNCFTCPFGGYEEEW